MGSIDLCLYIQIEKNCYHDECSCTYTYDEIMIFAKIHIMGMINELKGGQIAVVLIGANTSSWIEICDNIFVRGSVIGKIGCSITSQSDTMPIEIFTWIRVVYRNEIWRIFPSVFFFCRSSKPCRA